MPGDFQMAADEHFIRMNPEKFSLADEKDRPVVAVSTESRTYLVCPKESSEIKEPYIVPIKLFRSERGRWHLFGFLYNRPGKEDAIRNTAAIKHLVVKDKAGDISLIPDRPAEDPSVVYAKETMVPLG